MTRCQSAKSSASSTPSDTEIKGSAGTRTPQIGVKKRKKDETLASLHERVSSNQSNGGHFLTLRDDARACQTYANQFTCSPHAITRLPEAITTWNVRKQIGPSVGLLHPWKRLNLFWSKCSCFRVTSDEKTELKNQNYYGFRIRELSESVFLSSSIAKVCLFEVVCGPWILMLPAKFHFTVHSGVSIP